MKLLKTKLGILLPLAAASFFANASSVQWTAATGGNDHWYDIVTVSQGIDFNTARSASEGLGGHLATPELSGEAVFIYNNLVQPTAVGWDFFWLGAYTASPSLPWQWVTGGPVTAWGGSAYIDYAEGNQPYALMQLPISWWTSGVALQDTYQSASGKGFVVEHDQVCGNHCTPTPLPPAAWLFVSALAGLGVLGKGFKKSSALT